MKNLDVKSVMAAFWASFDRGSLDGMVACLHDDFEWTLPTGHADPRGYVVRGKAAARYYLQKRFFENKNNAPKFTERSIEICEQLAIVRLRVLARGVNGEKIDAAALEVYRVTDGKIRSKEAYWKQVSWPDS